MTQDKPVMIRSGLAEIELRKPAKSIAEVEREARAHGLSYGKYLAGYRNDSELERAAAERQAEREAEPKKTRRGKGRKAANRRRVVMMDADFHTLRVFDSQMEAAKETRFQQGNISAECVRYEMLKRTGGKLRPCKKGVRWRFATDDD